MVSVEADFREIAGTQAALGRAGAHTLVADRAEGKAGGLGLGFNGGQLLALALGGCYCNDMRFVAHRRNVALGRIDVKVRLELDGDPLVVQSAHIEAELETLDGTDPAEIIDAARDICTVANSLRRGMAVDIVLAGGDTD